MPNERLPDNLVPMVVKNLLSEGPFFFASMPLGAKAKILHRNTEISQLRALHKWLAEEIRRHEKGEESQSL